ncbi:hypothetical protein GW796_10960 [archaeon]|nr:hypothetical protein [archaeon]
MNSRVESSVNIQMLTQRLAKNIQLGVAGNEASYKLIKSDINSLDKYLTTFKNGESGFTKLEDELQSSIVTPLNKNYNVIEQKLTILQNNKTPIVDVSQKATEFNTRIKNLVKDFDTIYMLMIQRGVDNSKLTALQSLSSVVSNLNKNLGTAVTFSQVDLRLVSDLSSDYQTIIALIKSLTVEDPIEDKFLLNELITVGKNYEDFLGSIPDLLNNVKPLLDGKKAGTETLSILDVIYSDIDGLIKASEQEKSTLDSFKSLAYLLALLTVTFILLVGFINLKESQIRAWFTTKENDETDSAVIALMEELVPISEGNLKARATVTEHVTGSLADKINAMAESLQIAVKSTRSTSQEVSLQMAEVKEMISSASDLAKNAEDAAKKSNEASVAGSNMVNLAAEKMEEARSKMQETSKRVKRLGEVSQSIGLVTDLIEEMTEKTAVLALNTQLKAAESGSDGNSFRVIAEEIRKLSEESKKSLYTIRSNVQSMQSETQTVMLSIEQTTANVVDGSVLWEKAEKDLKLIQEAASKIEKVTLKLNELSNKQVEKAIETENNMLELNKSISHFNV